MIYLNAAGLTPFNPRIQLEADRIQHAFSQLLYSEEGIAFYRQTLDTGREAIARWLGNSDSSHIAFIPNATTGSCLVLSRITWTADDVIVTTTHENPTVIREMEALNIQGVKLLSLDPVSPEALIDQMAQALRAKKVRAILLSHVSHIDGRIFPLEHIKQLAAEHDVFFIIDGAQAVGHIPVNLQTLSPDAYFFPGHKWCEGPMGTGVLILGKKFQERPLRECSGGQVAHVRPWMNFELGTQHLGLIAGLAKACELKHQEGLHTDILQSFRSTVKDALDSFPQFQVLEWKGLHAPGILSCIHAAKPQDQSQSYSSTSHGPIIWKNFSLPETTQGRGMRLSWSRVTTMNELQLAITHLKSLGKS